MSAVLRVGMLSGALALAACGGSEDAARAGRERFAAAREHYQREFASVSPGASHGAATPPAGTTPAATPAVTHGLTPAGAPHAAGAATAPVAPSPGAPLPPGAASPASAPGAPGSSAPGTVASGTALPPGTAPLAAAAPTALAGGPGTGPARSGSARPSSSAPTGLMGGLVGPAGAESTTSAPGSPAAPTPGSSTATPAPTAPGGERRGAEATPDPAEPAPSPTPTPTPAEPAESDSKPPTLVSISFDPPSVADNSRTTMVVVASDNRAGADGAQGALVGPSGGNKVYVRLSPAPDGLSLLGQVKIPAAAEGGEWTVQYLTVTDKARNSATYTPGDDPVVRGARLTVQSQANDVDPPTLDSIAITPLEARDNTPVKAFVRASDAKSTVQTVRGNLRSPSGAVNLPFSSYLNKSTGLFEATMTIPPHAENGEWFVSELLVIDSAKNRLTVQAPDGQLAEAKVKVSSQEDKEPPRLNAVVASPSSVHPPGIVVLDINASDAISGVKSASGQLQMAASPSPLAFTSQRFAPGQFRAQIDVPNPAPLGTWRVISLTLTDYAGNKISLPASDPILAAATFEVQ